MESGAHGVREPAFCRCSDACRLPASLADRRLGFLGDQGWSLQPAQSLCRGRLRRSERTWPVAARAPWPTAVPGGAPGLWSGGRAPRRAGGCRCSAGAAGRARPWPPRPSMWSRAAPLALPAASLGPLPPRSPSLDGAATRVGTVCVPWGFPGCLRLCLFFITLICLFSLRWLVLAGVQGAIDIYILILILLYLLYTIYN